MKSETLTKCFSQTEPWETTPNFESAPVMEGPTVVKMKGKYYIFFQQPISKISTILLAMPVLASSDPITVNYGSEIDEYLTGAAHPELLKVTADLRHSNSIANGVSSIGFINGGKSALWRDEYFPIFLTRIVNFRLFYLLNVKM